MSVFLRTVDFINDKVGKAVSWLVLALTAVLAIEVVARYIFGKPTDFVYDLTWMFLGAYIVLGAAYTFLAEGHVRVDIFSSRLPQRKKALLEVILYLVFFFPLVGLLVYACTDFALISWSGDERSSVSLWKPPVYPFKIIMAIGFYLLALQGTAKFIQQLRLAIKGNP
ncbi:MAG: TRAP transporter small permease subunit [Syntrophaceae bacterium]|nr:TRAP transporter small permease subunit [Syntrophaceae bacterium]